MAQLPYMKTETLQLLWKVWKFYGLEISENYVKRHDGGSCNKKHHRRDLVFSPWKHLPTGNDQSNPLLLPYKNLLPHKNTYIILICPTAYACRGHRAFGLSIRSVRTSVRPSVERVKIFVQGRISRSINGSELIFHVMRMYLFEISREYTRVITSWTMFYSPLTSDFGQIIKFKISSNNGNNGDKLIFYIRMYLYETSRTIQEPWRHDLYFTVCWRQNLASFSWLRFLYPATQKVAVYYVIHSENFDILSVCSSAQTSGV